MLSLIQKSTVVSLDRYICTQFNMQLNIVLSSQLVAVVGFRVQIPPWYKITIGVVIPGVHYKYNVSTSISIRRGSEDAQLTSTRTENE